MGYTHYWTQQRDFKVGEWHELCEDFRALFAYFENVADIRLANGMGDMGTGPVITKDRIAFNGAGEDAHETFEVLRVRGPKESWQTRGGGFCKTARKPYDLAVTAALCYLSSITERHSVSSDGRGRNFVSGLEAARQALPRHANRLDIPMGIMEDDRWCQPYPRVECAGYDFRFCVDGRAYITRVRDGASYGFVSHFEAAQWAASFKEVAKPGGYQPTGDCALFNPYGSFDKARWAAIARQQAEALAYMVEVMATQRPDRALIKPPAYVRPGELPLMADDAQTYYSFAELLAAGQAAA